MAASSSRCFSRHASRALAAASFAGVASGGAAAAGRATGTAGAAALRTNASHASFAGVAGHSSPPALAAARLAIAR